MIIAVIVSILSANAYGAYVWTGETEQDGDRETVAVKPEQNIPAAKPAAGIDSKPTTGMVHLFMQVFVAVCGLSSLFLTILWDLIG